RAAYGRGPLALSADATFLSCKSSRPPGSTLFPYTTLFRSVEAAAGKEEGEADVEQRECAGGDTCTADHLHRHAPDKQFAVQMIRSEEHTSELQSLAYLVCRLLLEKKKFTSCSKRPSLQIRP